MTSKADVDAMADFVADAVWGAMKDEDDGDLGDQPEALQAQVRLVAISAMGAHDAWLTTTGYRLVKMNRQARRAVQPVRKPALLVPGSDGWRN
jgi:hypothetical protein